MPSYYNLPLANNVFDIEDVNKYNKLPFYMVMNEVSRFPIYKTWDRLVGTKRWQPNMGSIMRGIRPEFSPVGDTFVSPANITDAPTKNVFETLESAEESRLKLHRFESKQFHFLPSFQDFRDNQLKWNHDDIVRQIALFNERFIRGVVLSRSPNLMVAGDQGGELNLGSPTGDMLPVIAGTQTSFVAAGGGGALVAKTSAYLQAQAETVGQGLTLKVVYKACNILDDDLGAPTFEGTINSPRDNELVKGKYVLITSTEAWRAFVFDDSVANLKSLELDLLFDGFRGSLFGMVTAKAEKFPLRMTENGVFHAPQITDNSPHPTIAGATVNKTRPNPNYTDINISPFEFAFLVGEDGYNSITVGPPPKEFTQRSMDAEKFYSLRWNGEVQLTDQVLIKYADGTLDLNRYGTQLQLISQAVMGVLPAETNNVLPVLFRRRRVATT